ncbi:sulfur transfer complex subunit TusB [Tatumella morbirosei]|uniref:Protein TusB n=1 Tax=Tatumella morbirosei TaxID=642227 RepID=A0A095TRT1_9GAMM|nr:sulfurtransferase complex subunit TusB [Tatumella morbirosei]KGD79561.1 sulfur transfer complex subunit TusB [Tatumella morbirosei]
MLHTLMRSPWQTDIRGMIMLLSADDDLLLLQDGVLAAVEGNELLRALLQSPATLYVLQEDAAARGITTQISVEVQKIGYNEFVELTVRHQQQLAW